MADEDPTQTAQPAQLPWVTSTQDMVKALLQGGQTPASSGGQVLSADQLNPWLKVLEKETQGPSINPMRPDLSMQPQVPGQSQISAPTTSGKLPNPAPTPAPVQTAQIPVSSIMQMAQHQVNPQVEAAKQRVLQVLMQRPHSIAPPSLTRG